MLEALAQLSGILAHASSGFDGETHLLVVLAIDKARFRRSAFPGDRVDLTSELSLAREGSFKVRGRAEVDGELCTEAEILLSLVLR